MKRIGMTIALLLWAGIATAQVEVGLRLDRQRYIVFEPVNMEVTLKNTAGRALAFENLGSIQVEMSDAEGRPVPETGHTLDLGQGLILPSGGTKRVTVKLNSYFRLQKSGNYKAAVRVRHRLLRYDFVSENRQFVVREGQKVWESLVGVPSPIPNTPVETRRCSVLMFHDDSGDSYIFMVEDERRVYTVSRLGPRVRGVDPQCAVDALSRVHTLVQVAPRQFAYRIFDVHGKVLQQKAYVIEDSIPRLLTDPDVGRVMVAGGREAIPGVDYARRVDDPGPIAGPPTAPATD
jgi:hypothetical protein